MKQNSSVKKRILINPSEIVKENKYHDDSRSGNWERIKNTFVKDIPKIDFDDIGGYEQAKRELMFIVKGLTGADIEATIQFAIQPKIMEELFENKKPKRVRTRDIFMAIDSFKKNRRIIKKEDNTQFYI